MDVPQFAQPPEMEQPPEAKGFFASHPYGIALSGVAFLVLIGAIFVITRSAAAPSAESTWSGVGGAAPETSAQPSAGVDTLPAPQASAQGAGGTIVVDLSALQTEGSAPSDSDVTASGLDALLLAISTTSIGGTGTFSASTSAQIADAYALIPRGLVATTSAIVPSKSALQRALYSYGNVAGAIIQTYEDTHKNAAQVLKDQSTDRSSPDKAAQVVAIGNALTRVGRDLAGSSEVPPPVLSYNSALAKSYQDIGGKLTLVAKAQSDADFIAAIQTYDAAVDSFTRNYVALATYLSGNGVTFSSSDPGSVFSFNAVSL